MLENIQEPAKNVLDLRKYKKSEQLSVQLVDITGEWLTKDKVSVLEIAEDFPEAMVIELGDTGVSIVVNKLLNGNIGIGILNGN